MSGWVYIVTNEAIPGLVKVGYTTRSDLKLRLQEFNRAELPYPYEEAYALWVEEPRLIEQRVHQALATHRENKEWFRCSVEHAKKTIQEIAGPESAKATIQKIVAQHPGILTEFVRKDPTPKPERKTSEEIIEAAIQKAEEIEATQKADKAEERAARNIAEGKAKIDRRRAEEKAPQDPEARLFAQERAWAQKVRENRARRIREGRRNQVGPPPWDFIVPVGLFFLAMVVGSC